jgi:hypothetical protein
LIFLLPVVLLVLWLLVPEYMDRLHASRCTHESDATNLTSVCQSEDQPMLTPDHEEVFTTPPPTHTLAINVFDNVLVSTSVEFARVEALA